MIAFNAGPLDACKPDALPAALQKILDGLERESLPLDAICKDWPARLNGWLGAVP